MHTRLISVAIAGTLLFASCASRPTSAQQQPVAARPAVSRIAFGSCLRSERPQPIWSSIADAKPDLFIFLGDNIYGDSPDPAVLRAKYDETKSNEGFAKLRSSAPILATWDDHDMGKNDAGVEFEAKESAKEELFRFLDEPADSARRSRPGVYDSYTFGPPGQRVQIILLDTRWFRSPLKQTIDGKIKSYVPDNDPTKTILGEAQWSWLEAQLKQPADVRLIGSSIQVLSAEHRFEKWNNFPHERDRLLSLLDKTSGTSVILTGDRHTAEISKLDNAGRPIFDVTASSLNTGTTKPDSKPSPESNPLRVAGDRVNQSNFGLIEIDWSKSPPTMSLQIRDQSGSTVREQTLAAHR